MEGWTMILVRSERGESYLRGALDAGVLELRQAEEEPQALKVMDRLARKQRQRVKASDPHAAARWPTDELLSTALRAEAAPDGDG